MSTNECDESSSDTSASPCSSRSNSKGRSDLQPQNQRPRDVQPDPEAKEERVVINVPSPRIAKSSNVRRRARVRSRTWVGTLNNPKEADRAYYATVSLEQMDWIVVGDEVGDKGTPHLQMACHFVNPVDMTVAQRIFGRNKSHIEAMKGSCSQSFTYCSKEKLLVHRGIMPADKGKAKEDKMATLVKSVQQGKTDREIFESLPAMFLRYRSSLSHVKSLYAGDNARESVEVYWFWGETGAGKSYRAEAEAKDDGRSLYRQNGGFWWCGYDQHHLVIIDDLAENACFKDLLKVLDVYNVLVPNKGGHTWLKARKIWVTASFPPSKIDQGGQLERRVTRDAEFPLRLVEMKKAERPDIRAHFKPASVDVADYKDMMD